MLSRIGGLVERRGAAVLVVALLTIGVAALFGLGVASRLGPIDYSDSTTQSARANVVLARAGALGPDFVVHVAAGEAGDGPVLRQRVARVRRILAAEPMIARVRVAFVRARRSDGAVADAAYVRCVLHHGSDGASARAAPRIARSVGAVPGTIVGGPALVDSQIIQTVKDDFRRAELLAFPLVFALSLLFFRGLVAATLPPLVGAMAILGTMLLLRILSGWTQISILSLNLITSIGLALAVDYSLLMVNRYREELARHGPTPAALRATMLTAGRTVLFSSLTIAAVMASLLIFPQNFLYSMGVGGLIVALVTAVVALVVLPAILAALGSRVNAFSPRWLKRRAAREAQPLTSGFWYRLSAFVTRHAAPVAAGIAALLLLICVPATRMTLALTDAGALPKSASVRQLVDVAAADGSLQRASSVRVLVRDARRSDARRMARRMAVLPGVAHVGAVRPLPGGLFVIGVQPSSPTYSPSSEQLIDRIRSRPTAGRVLVSGPTAEFVDLKSSLLAHLPLASILVVTATMLSLFLMTGSLVMGVKVLLMNTVTLGVVYGLLVLGFQDGRLESILGFTSVGAIDVGAPILLLVTVFALSTDYGLFLLARIKEAYDSGMSNTDAVAVGQERAGRTITSAAALFCVSVGALTSSRLLGVQETAFGIAAAVLIDATLVRALLVPALMHLLGEWNWWAPRPLRRLHRRAGLSDTGLHGKMSRSS